MKIVETVYGYYSYHLSETGKAGQLTLCGRKDVMQTEVPLSAWGFVGHLNEKWCKDCWNKFQSARSGAK